MSPCTFPSWTTQTCQLSQILCESHEIGIRLTVSRALYINSHILSTVGRSRAFVRTPLAIYKQSAALVSVVAERGIPDKSRRCPHYGWTRFWHSLSARAYNESKRVLRVKRYTWILNIPRSACDSLTDFCFQRLASLDHLLHSVWRPCSNSASSLESTRPSE